MEDDLIVPLFAHNEPGPRYKVGQAAKLLEEPGTPAKTLESQIRSLAQRRLIHVRGARGSGPTAHNLYALADVAAAGIFSRLASDLSVSDNALMLEVSRALYTWYEGEPMPAEHRNSPILTALWDTLTNEDRWWVFDLRVYRNAKTGDRQFNARLYETSDTTKHWRSVSGDDFPRVSAVIHLRPLLLQIGARVVAN